MEFDEQKAVDRLYAAVRPLFDADGVAPSAVVRIITAAMAEAERLAGASGAQKRAAVLRVAAHLVGEVPDGDARAAAMSAVALLGPSIVDAVADASKGRLAINGAPPCCAIC